MFDELSVIEISFLIRFPLQAAPEADEPPFNFQGMLRKTKYNRNSMKRNAESRLSLPHEDSNNNSGWSL